MAIITNTVHDADLERFCSIPGLGELTAEAVRAHNPDLLITYDSNGNLAGRASLWWSQVPQHPGERLGLIGHYAAKNASSSAEILNAACSELARRGCTRAVAPMDGSTWRRYRLLSERGSEPLFFLEPDNPDDWPLHFENQGFSPFANYYSTLNEDISRPFPLRLPTNFNIRPLDTKRIEEELHCLWQLATRGFAGNFLYTPIEESEFRAIYQRLLLMIRPELVLIAEANGKPAGFCFALVDMLQASRGVKVDTYIVKTLAVLPEYRGDGIGNLFFTRINEVAAKLGIRRGIYALMHEDTLTRQKGVGHFRDIRRYTLYSKSI